MEEKKNIILMNCEDENGKIKEVIEDFEAMLTKEQIENFQQCIKMRNEGSVTTDDTITIFCTDIKAEVQGELINFYNTDDYKINYIEGVEVNEERICSICDNKIHSNESHIEKVIMNIKENEVEKVIAYLHFECPSTDDIEKKIRKLKNGSQTIVEDNHSLRVFHSEIFEHDARFIQEAYDLFENVLDKSDLCIFKNSFKEGGSGWCGIFEREDKTIYAVWCDSSITKQNLYCIIIE